MSLSFIYFFRKFLLSFPKNSKFLSACAKLQQLLARILLAVPFWQMLLASNTWPIQYCAGAGAWHVAHV